MFELMPIICVINETIGASYPLDSGLQTRDSMSQCYYPSPTRVNFDMDESLID
jgi:hypothetical protein